MKSDFLLKEYVLIAFITSLWVNASEMFRYYIIVRPEMQQYFEHIPDVAPANIAVFGIWGVWDIILSLLYVFTFWLCGRVFGNNLNSILLSTIMSFFFFSVLFWVSLANMNLTDWSFLLLVLPLAFIETLVASLIASTAYLKYSES